MTQQVHIFDQNDGVLRICSLIFLEQYPLDEIGRNTLIRFCFRMDAMRGGFRSILSNGSVLKNAVLQGVRLGNAAVRPLLFSRHE